MTDNSFFQSLSRMWSCGQLKNTINYYCYLFLEKFQTVYLLNWIAALSILSSTQSAKKVLFQILYIYMTGMFSIDIYHINIGEYIPTNNAISKKKLVLTEFDFRISYFQFPEINVLIFRLNYFFFPKSIILITKLISNNQRLIVIIVHVFEIC